MNEMRKLMETVEALYEDSQLGFKNIVTSVQHDDVKVSGKAVFAKTIWVYDNANYNRDNPRQRDFTRQEQIDVTTEGYNELVNEIAFKAQDAYNDAVDNTDDPYGEGLEYVYDAFAIGADVGERVNKRLIHDVLAKADLSDVPATLSDDGDYIVLNVEHPELKKKRWWNR